MRYFSRIRLDINHPRAAEALQAIGIADVYRDHQWLWRFFSNQSDTARDFLFRRMEPQGQHTHPIYYVVSKRVPTTPHSAWIVDSREYAPQIRGGDRLSFELRVNPVITRNGRRHDVVMDGKTAAARRTGHGAWNELSAKAQSEITGLGYDFVREQIGKWLNDSERNPGFATRHGFVIPRDREPTPLQTNAYQRHRLPEKDRNGSLAWFTSVDLSGELIVTDVNRFSTALCNGAGHAKAFGCGLLLIRRT